LASPAEHGVHPPRHLLLPLLQDVPIGVRREHDGAVPQQVLDVLKGEALRQQERRGGMPQVVEADVRQSRSL